MQNQFGQRLAFGQIAEGQIEAWLRRVCRYQILPAYEGGRDNKGPRLFGYDSVLITPDMLAIRGKDTRWIEAKHKTHFAWYRIGKAWTTGIDYHHYTQYVNVATVTPWPVWLLFLHSRDDSPDGFCPTGLFGGEITYLKANIDHVYQGVNNYGKGGMVYWRYQTLKQLATLKEVQNAAREMGYKAA